MKKLTILLMSGIVIGLFLVSFTKVENPNALIEGKWVYSQKGIETNNGEVLKDYLHEFGCDQDYVEFFKNGEVNDCSFFSGKNCELTIETGYWIKSGNELTINFSFTTEETAEIILLNKNTLKIRAKSNGKSLIYVYKKR